jgi:hypothetical protein
MFVNHMPTVHSSTVAVKPTIHSYTVAVKPTDHSYTVAVKPIFVQPSNTPVMALLSSFPPQKHPLKATPSASNSTACFGNFRVVRSISGLDEDFHVLTRDSQTDPPTGPAL